MHTGTYGIWFWLNWYVFGIGIGMAVTTGFFLLKAKEIVLKWYEWIIVAVITFLIGFAFQNFFGSFAEEAARAAWLSLVFIGFPAVVLGVVLWRLLSARMTSEEA